MADEEDEFSTLALRVDLECDECKKRIKKIICKLQGPMNIQVIKFLEKNNVVILSGPFNPDELTKRLKCLDCKCNVIKDIKIVPRDTSTSRKGKCKQASDVEKQKEQEQKSQTSDDEKHKEQEQKSQKCKQTSDDEKHKERVQKPVCRCGPCRDDGHCRSRCCRCSSCGFTFVYASDGPPVIYNCGDVTSGDLAAYRSYSDEPNYTCAIM